MTAFVLGIAPVVTFPIGALLGLAIALGQEMQANRRRRAQDLADAEAVVDDDDEAAKVRSIVRSELRIERLRRGIGERRSFWVNLTLNVALLFAGIWLGKVIG